MNVACSQFVAHPTGLSLTLTLNEIIAGQTARRAESDPMTSWLSSASRSKPNVLFLLVDDFRPFLRSYGESFMVTPNIDQLASKSVRFDRAYAQQAVCVPSRLSFTTGRRPLTLKVLDLKTYWRDPVRGGGNFTTLSQYFQQNGYVSHGAGKIYHNGKGGGDHNSVEQQDREKRSASYIYVNETATEKLKDTLVTDHAIRWLENRDTQKPFFLAVGFSKPHLPFAFPQKFLALYDETNIQLAKYRTPPAGLPRFVLNSWGELRGYADIKALGLASNELVLPDDVQFKLKQAYAAAVTHVDDQVGRLLSRLSELGLTNNTIITFISDHGL
ncbi:hypothetical protein BaRGS_00040561 [Batillaria attramentaria]|uniref:Sulfatase N-terminal domain-containing protein n=1 Tax=Batillaria attramentaria TaxID=370345 RepID=A0ABD0IZM2_9CAEN